ncbi:hypothetical protein J7399_05235 [Shimia sp. R9_1]|nr:hypothetical protein [Shimia sp. R9_1]
MSDAVTNTEIEDVLSSIRRLVSDNRSVDAREVDVSEDAAAPLSAFRGEAEASTEAQTEADETASATDTPLALVLTPAQRVPEADDLPEADVESTSAAGEETLASARQADEFSFDADIVRASKEDPYEPKDPFALSPLEAEDDLDIEAFANEALSDSDEYAVEEEALSAVEDVVETVDAEAEGDAAEVTDEAADLPQEPIEEDRPFDFKQVLETRIHQFRDAETVEDVAAIDMAAAERAHHEEDVVAAEAMMADLEGKIHEEVLQSAELPGIEDLAETLEETSEIDEAMLREMVADIVRQELQGALGERITRNVRKLVRREIHRALAAHDLG